MIVQFTYQIFTCLTSNAFRKPLGEAFGLKSTSSIFDSDFSNNIADKVGFKLDIEYSFDEIKKMYPQVDFGDVNADKMTMKTWLF